MENVRIETNNCFEKLVLINEELKSKPKATLTKKIQKRINEAFTDDRFELFKRLSQLQDKLAAPIKQGIAEYLRLNPEEGENRTSAVNFIRILRDKSRKNDQLQYLTTLVLWRHGHFENGDNTLIKRWLTHNENTRKLISEKTPELLGDKNLRWVVNTLVQCKEIIPELDIVSWDDSKKAISEAINAFSPDATEEGAKDDLDALENLMKDSCWVKTTRDQLLIANIENCKSRMSPKSETKKQELQKQPPDDGIQGPLLPAKIVDKAVISTDPNSHLLGKQQKQRTYVTPDRLKNKQKVKPETQIENNTHQTSKPTISIEGLNVVQEKLISRLVKEIATSNLETTQKKIRLRKLETECERFSIQNNNLMYEKQVYEEANDELVKKVEMLRERLKESLFRLEEERSARKEDKKRLERKLEETAKQYESCQLELKKTEETLEKERQLSQATHRDAIYRADVELQTKLTQISQAVLPIFKEFEDADFIPNLPPRAQMLLNISKKLKNALKSKGVMI